MEAGPHSVPKELILQTHVFSFDCLSPLLSLAWHTAWKGGGTVETGQLAKEIKLLRKKAPVWKFQPFLGHPLSTGEIHFYIWKDQVPSLWNLLVVCGFFSGAQEYPDILYIYMYLDIYNIKYIFWGENIIQEPECFWFYLPQCEHAANTDAVSYFWHWKWGPNPQRWANS